MDSLLQQLEFFKELEKLKTITRSNRTLDGRFENSAEHSWQGAVLAILFKDLYPLKVDMERVLKMFLLHDLGEVYAGDTSVFDKEGKRTSYERELASVTISFGKLPESQEKEFLELWQEFEQGNSPESRYARVIDALVPLMSHWFVAPDGETDTVLTEEMVLSSKLFIKEESEPLWELAQDLIADSVKKGLYHKH